MMAIEMKGITKRFSGIIANNQADFLVEKGEIHCLLGENGAGKTTLMKVLFGLYKPDEGTIAINGQNNVAIDSPRAAYGHGIGMVHQHFMLVNSLTVLDNIILGNEPGRFSIDRKESRRLAQSFAGQYHFDIDLDAKISQLSVGMKQRVEILKTLYRGAEIIILDEPTAVLTPLEAAQLLDVLRDMKQQGKTIVFITHKLGETMAIADRVTIMRNGRSVAVVAAGDTTPQKLANLMIGKEISLEIKKEPCKPGKTVLSLRNVRLLPNAVSGVSFGIHAGEIFGVAGVEGNGQQQLEEMIMGLSPCKSGKIELNGTDITSFGSKKRRKLRIAYIPSDRYKQAILPQFSLSENYLLGNQYREKFVKRGLIDQSYLENQADTLMKEYDVRAVSKSQPVNSLSGGNQQKLVLSREVSKNPDLVVACQPVRGLDIGAIQYIHHVLLALRSQGKAILLVSAELSDLFGLADCIGVLYKGELMSVRPTESYTNESISLLMAGKKPGESNGAG